MTKITVQKLYKLTTAFIVALTLSHTLARTARVVGRLAYQSADATGTTYLSGLISIISAEIKMLTTQHRSILIKKSIYYSHN